MAALLDFIDLRTAVVERVKTSDITDVLTRLTLQAEEDFARKIRNRRQITPATVTFANGAAPLPADYLEMINVFDAYGCSYDEVPYGAESLLTGGNGIFSINQTSILIPGFSGAAQISYFAKIPTVTTDMITTNWLLANHSDVYLYGVSWQAAKYLRDADMAASEGGMYKTALDGLKAEDDRQRFSKAAAYIHGDTP